MTIITRGPYDYKNTAACVQGEYSRRSQVRLHLKEWTIEVSCTRGRAEIYYITQQARRNT